ncbi:hypothetical protein UFOVP785_96 [uncultured Caudovirales phage]|uniref:Uncharacterized protein n=1 Tax=uncultured Caudovirales phage TaxID=2100421 RepID=A0A6J5NSG0_9CAUD|nr:hypothetical protein UFOVP785_96 [uncultured Caudovirales phage]
MPHSLAQTNVNPVTGIRYGIISLRSLHDDLVDDLMQHGTNLSYEYAWEEYKAENELTEEQDDIENHRQEFADGYMGDEDVYEGVYEGVTYRTTSHFGLFVFESPHVTHARLCSPCVPNCGDLDNVDLEGGYECYDVPPDWRYVSDFEQMGVM